MSVNVNTIKPGADLVSPGGRHAVVKDVLVPATADNLRNRVSPQFQNLKRKLVIFDSGAQVPLKDVKRMFKPFVPPQQRIAFDPISH